VHVKLALAGVVLSLAVVPGCGGSPCGETEGTVMRIVDGDTIELADARKIRLLLVDTPETTGGQDDCYGQEAKQFTTDTLLNKQIELEYDVECTDRFGRTLAYVTVDGQEINKLMIQRGYACVLHISPDGDARVDECKALQLDAMRSGRGLWGACNPLPPACE
jgi:micrococcal nuclease